MKEDKKQRREIEVAIISDQVGVQRFKETLREYQKKGWKLDGNLTQKGENHYVQKLYKEKV